MAEQPGIPVDEIVQRLHRSDWGRLLSLLISRTRRLDLAEDALGEAFGRAVARWRSDGVPSNPAGWIYQTAYRQILGWLRAEAVAGRKAPLLAVRPETESVGLRDELGDDRLQLILLCCHPALAVSSRPALALRLVLGISTEQIARLFLVSKPTMAARLTRAKKKIAVAGIPLSNPVADELDVRLDGVCRTIYLAFTAGYSPGSGPDLLRADIAGEAVRLATVLRGLVPHAAQVRALSALLTLQHSRRDARLRHGQLVTLDEQDRSSWHRSEIEAGMALADGLSSGLGYGEELRLQALIAAEHVRPTAAADTDWSTIAALYTSLVSITGSAVVQLNRAVAVAEVDGPEAGLKILESLDAVMPDGHRLASVRADLARRSGQFELARNEYGKAIAHCSNDVERAFLASRLDSLGALEP